MPKKQTKNKMEYKVIYETINGKQVPIYKIPPGVSSLSEKDQKNKNNNYYKEDDSDNEDISSSPELNKYFDEENFYLETDSFIDY